MTSLTIDSGPYGEATVVLQRGSNERMKVVVGMGDPRITALLDAIIGLETDPEAKPYPEAYKEMTCSRMATATSTASRPAPPRRRPRLLDRGLDRIWKMWAGQ